VLPTSFELTRDSWAPFAEARLTSTFGLSMQAVCASTSPTAKVPVTSPRVRWNTNSRVRFHAAGAWGKAFKLPSMYALGHPLVGNPGPRPRTRRVWEDRTCADLARRQGALERHLVRGCIPQCHRLRSGSATHAGQSQSASIRRAWKSRAGWHSPKQWQIDASVTHVESRVASTGGQLRNRPEWRAGTSAHWNPLESLQLSAR
jgi:hypothetical protein